jgi:methyltransferase (TIGR00027 family)
MKPISKTAFYCCGVRMQDAERSAPVCNDIYAKLFMNEDGLNILEAFKDDIRPNESNVARHRIIDDLVQHELDADSDRLIVLIGAGFDSRAFRLKGGSWVELDEPQVMSYKNERLPSEKSPNELQRIPIDFASESVEDKLARFSNRSAVIVIEGVFMYLETKNIDSLLQTLGRLFPKHKLICDLMTREFFENSGKTINEKITGMGAPFKFTPDNPEEVFLKAGYELNDEICIIEKSVVFQMPNIPATVLDGIRSSLPTGYSIYAFEKK